MKPLYLSSLLVEQYDEDVAFMIACLNRVLTHARSEYVKHNRELGTKEVYWISPSNDWLIQSGLVQTHKGIFTLAERLKKLGLIEKEGFYIPDSKKGTYRRSVFRLTQKTVEILNEDQNKFMVNTNLGINHKLATVFFFYLCHLGLLTEDLKIVVKEFKQNGWSRVKVLNSITHLEKIGLIEKKTDKYISLNKREWDRLNTSQNKLTNQIKLASGDKTHELLIANNDFLAFASGTSTYARIHLPSGDLLMPVMKHNHQWAVVLNTFLEELDDHGKK